jgi:hypothetical protein
LSQAAIALETNQLLVPFDDSPMGVFDPDHVMPPMPTSLQSAAALRTDAVVRSAIVVPVSYTREQPRKWWQD